jgi:hypothetical protein
MSLPLDGLQAPIRLSGSRLGLPNVWNNMYDLEVLMFLDNYVMLVKLA